MKETVPDTVSPVLRHTPGHEDCPACKRADMLINLDTQEIAYLPFSDAAELWMALRMRKNNLRPRTHDSTKGYLDAMQKFFGAMRLNQITAGSVREYQLARSKNEIQTADGVTHPWKHPASNSLINHELSVLGQMLTRAKLWQPIKANYAPFPIPKWSPRQVLSEEDEEHLFTVASRSQDAQLAYWVATITNNTTAAGCELRGLRLKHIFLRQPKIDQDGIDRDPSEIYIPSDAVKNESRPRKIALNLTAKWAIEQCYRRALELGSCQPNHYLFPFRVKRNCYDPTRPPSRWWIRDSWKKLRKHSGLAEICPHDLRHQCITRMLERGVDGETVRAIAGHVTEEMMQYYSHIRRQAKYAAVMAIEPSGPRDGNRRKKPSEGVGFPERRKAAW